MYLMHGYLVNYSAKPQRPKPVVVHAARPHRSNSAPSVSRFELDSVLFVVLVCLQGIFNHPKPLYRCTQLSIKCRHFIVYIPTKKSCLSWLALETTIEAMAHKALGWVTCIENDVFVCLVFTF